MKRSLIALAVALTACGPAAAGPGAPQTLAEARAGRDPGVVARLETDDALPTPPRGVFDIVHFPSEVGPLGAYLTPDPHDGQKHPAIIWITGSDSNALGQMWQPSPASNDQSASAFRVPGLVLMLPTLRGGNDNPGEREGAYGEVKDVLAAADWLAKQPWVDPSRIYLGGHSTGGTLVLLTAETSDRFRAVFSFGPASLLSADYMKFMGVRVEADADLDRRSPILFLSSVRSPVFVIEGDHDANTESALQMKLKSVNPNLRFNIVRGADHFSVLRPTSALMARKILADTGPTSNIAFTDDELAAPFGR